MAFRYPVTLGGIIPDPSVRKPVEAVVNDLNRSGVWRRLWTVDLTDVGGGVIGYEFDEDTTATPIASATYADGTGVSVTVTPFNNEKAVVVVSGGATFHGLGSASEGWLQISDGTTGYAQQVTTITDTGFHPLSCAWTGEVETTTTFTLQQKKTALATADFESYRRHLAVTYWRQADVGYRIPVHVGRGGGEVVRGAKIVSVYDRAKSNGSYNRVRLGVQDARGTEFLATYSGQTQSLLAGEPFDMAGRELSHRLLDGQVVILEVERSGVPPSLVGVSVEVAVDLIGT